MSERKQNWYTRFVKWFWTRVCLSKRVIHEWDAGGGSAFTLFSSTREVESFRLV